MAFNALEELKKTIRKNPFDIRFDSISRRPIAGCAETARGAPVDVDHAPILEPRAVARLGHCHRVEAWTRSGWSAVSMACRSGGVLGESMFARETNASKTCLFYLVERLKARGFALLDTPIHHRPPQALRRGRRTAPANTRGCWPRR